LATSSFPKSYFVVIATSDENNWHGHLSRIILNYNKNKSMLKSKESQTDLFNYN
jgi:hypothetical protein